MSFFRKRKESLLPGGSSVHSAGAEHKNGEDHDVGRNDPPDSKDREDHDPASINNSQYAHKRRELLEIVHDLRGLGSEKELDVPQIAVIGKQSAGKSSLVEAVTGIKVPRDAQTCTRCPMECTITADSPIWSCTVAIRGRSEDFSGAIYSKDEVELWIRRAQAAVLCPHLSAGTLRNKSREELKEITDPSVHKEVLKFSKNVVEVRISDPEGSDLMFVDLPGLIQNDDDDGVINMVEEMASESISSSSTIILVTVPADDDLDNQGAMKLARMADKSGERTIGIVTKADRVSGGATSEQKAWKDLFQGQTAKHKLHLGYYAVSLPDDKQRADNISRRDAQRMADIVFDTRAPWKDLRATGRLGVQALVRDISPLLLKMLVDAIPRLKATVSELLDACLKDIGKLPPARTHDTATDLVLLIDAFCAAVVNMAKGTSEDKSFVHRSRDAFNAFKAAIQDTAPDFRPFEHPSQFRKPEDPSYVQKDLTCVPKPPSPRKATLSLPSMPSHSPVIKRQEPKRVSSRESLAIVSQAAPYYTVHPSEPVQLRQRSPPSILASPTRSIQESEEVSVSSDLLPPPADERGTQRIKVTMGLLDVRRVIKEETSWELPGNIPYSAKTRLIQQFVRDWGVPSERCFSHMQKILTEFVFNELIPLHFVQFYDLQVFVRDHLKRKLEEFIAHSNTAVKDVLKREEAPYTTQNIHYFETTRDTWMLHYKKIRACHSDYWIQSNGHHNPEYKAPSLPSRPPNQKIDSDYYEYITVINALHAWRPFRNVTYPDLHRLLPPDEFEQELDVMADVRGYFEVAYKRITDELTQTLLHDFVGGFANSLQACLLDALDFAGNGASERIQRLLQEDPRVKKERLYLNQRRERLENIKARLESFQI